MLSVCIVNWNTCDLLRDCLSSLLSYPSSQDTDTMEVIVVDNASSDGSATMVASEFPQTILIANSDNKGYAEGNNQALIRAKGGILLLLNPDIVLNTDTLPHALSFLVAHPRCGALGCRLIGTDGQTQRSVRGFPDPGPVLWEFLGLPRLFPHSKTLGAYRMTYFDYNQPAQVDQPMGTFLMIPRAALTDVGLLDTQFPIFFNEVDWCWRAKREHGWEIWYTPDASLIHHGGSSTRLVRPAMIREAHRSLLHFYDKHLKGSVAPPLLWLIRRAVLFNEWRLCSRK
jgi:N-acetylglucosaminyl-diphospho-decaprenol L-rhamnosyltransferase